MGRDNDEHEHDRDADDVPTRAASRESRPARLANDPMRYIRRVKGGRYQARPYCDGERRSLGTFDTIHEAREAIRRYFWGKLTPPPRFTKKVVHGNGVAVFVAAMPIAGFWVRIGRPQATREAAAKIAADFIIAFYGGRRGEEMLRGVEPYATWGEKQRRARGMV